MFQHSVDTSVGLQLYGQAVRLALDPLWRELVCYLDPADELVEVFPDLLVRCGLPARSSFVPVRRLGRGLVDALVVVGALRRPRRGGRGPRVAHLHEW